MPILLEVISKIKHNYLLIIIILKISGKINFLNYLLKKDLLQMLLVLLIMLKLLQIHLNKKVKEKHSVFKVKIKLKLKM
jgi:hypothetical protein